MTWNEKVQQVLANLPAPIINDIWRQRCVRLIDLTSLNSTDTEESIALFCQKARTAFGEVAGVCVYPDYIRLVADQFADSAIAAVTVANFPSGEATLETVLIQINRALESGADEIDVVFPYKRYLANDKIYAKEFVTACKAACGPEIVLKIILETGALRDLDIIAEASRDALFAGADFIKTATGKIATGATLEAATVMLLTTKALRQQKPHAGVKVSGGIHRLTDALLYILLAEHIMGESWVSSKHFRIGASRLIDALSKS